MQKAGSHYNNHNDHRTAYDYQHYFDYNFKRHGYDDYGNRHNDHNIHGIANHNDHRTGSANRFS